ncbi:hypothetical protein B296_00009555 [Ensete ventricosum]|uniref:Uncharacterized protein n=1 Tax=Ensete ventricosum TaxID=4639 RepID=A0A426Z6L0_ENSVE|nr:hypothetical protein B296_00009555 [Ensete ventricosum]
MQIVYGLILQYPCCPSFKYLCSLHVVVSSRIEVSYQEAVALKRQEELIREEEAAGQAENELKSKRGATEKEKRAKKKQKRNSRKAKERVKDERCNQVPERLQLETPLEERISDSFLQQEIPSEERISDSFPSEQVELVNEKIGTLEDASDVSDAGDDVIEVVQPGSNDRDSSPINWDIDTSETHLATEASVSDVQNGQSEKRSQSAMDDSSSTCSTDSVPSVTMSGPYKGSSLQSNNNIQSRNRGKGRNEETHERMGLTNGGNIPRSETIIVDGHSHDVTGSKVPRPESEASVFSIKSEMQRLEKNLVEKSEAPKQSTQGKINGPHQFNATSRPYSAPLIPAPRPTVPIPSTVQAVPLLSRSVSAAGRLGTDPSPSAPSFIPQSYRNAIIGKTTSARGSCLNDDTTSCSQSVAYSHSPSMFLSSTSMLPPQTPIRMDHPSLRHGLTFGCLKPEVVHSQHIGRDDSYHESSSSSSSQSFGSSLGDNMGKLNVDGKSLAQKYPAESASRVTPYHVQGTVGDEFPHLDIINDLLDDEQNVGRTVRSPPYAFSRQFSFPGNLSTADTGSLGSSGQFEQLDQYYDEGFHRGYGASNNPPEGLRDGRMQQMDLLAYANRQFDGLMRNQQPYGITDLSMLSLRDGDVNGYSYQLQDYFARGGNGYLYRP